LLALEFGFPWLQAAQSVFRGRSWFRFGMRFDSRYTAIVPGDRFQTDPVSEKTVEYEYEKNGREKNIGPNVLLATSIFSLAPWNPFLAYLEIREWKETPSHARASFLGGIGFIGPNAPFARNDGQARADGACEPKDFPR
jgi:hypothetical protein